MLQATNLLDQAVARDPAFFEAYCQLAHTHDRLYHLGYDHSPARVARAEAALQSALRLRPDTGEAHLARAEHLYRGYVDYDGALAELDAASRAIPNNSQVFELKGYILRRQGKQHEGLQNLERAADLDPRNVLLLQQIALSYDHLRRYSEEKSAWERALSIAPDDVHTLLPLANVELQWKADVEPLRRLVDSIRSAKPELLPAIADAWLICALIDRNADAARDALIALGDAPLSYEAVELNHLVLQGIIARMGNDDAKARASFTAARAEQRKTGARPAELRAGVVCAWFDRRRSRAER